MPSPRLLGCLALAALLSACASVEQPGAPAEAPRASTPSPSAAGLPAPARLYVTGEWAGGACGAHVALGSAKPVYLGPGDYMIAEVWGDVPMRTSVVDASGLLDIGCSREGEAQSTIVEINAYPGMHRVFEQSAMAVPRPGRQTVQATPLERRYLEQNPDWALVAQLSAAETFRGQTYHGRPFVGQLPARGNPGFGRVALEDGEFVGELRDDGFLNGAWTYSDGSSYTGEFRGFAPGGQGRMIMADGRSFAGSFRDGVPDGEGVCAARSRLPEYCAASGGKEIPPPDLRQVAARNVDAAMRQETEELSARSRETIRAIDEEMAQISDLRDDAPERIPLERAKMLNQCSCYVTPSGGKTHFTCLGAVSGNPTAEEEEALKEAIRRERKICHAWVDRTGGMSIDQQVEAELARLDADLRSAGARRQAELIAAEQRMTQLRQRQEAEREARNARAQAEEQARRKRMLEEQERSCAAKIAQDVRAYGFSCGCGAGTTPKPPPAPNATACPA